MDGKGINDKETVADFNVKLKAVEKRAEDVAFVRNVLQARLQQSQSGQDEVGESITRIQDKLNRFSSRLKGDQEYTKSRADEECSRIIKQP